jgi:hypothetical protein
MKSDLLASSGSLFGQSPSNEYASGMRLCAPVHMSACFITETTESVSM